MKVKVAKSCPTPCDPNDDSLPDSSFHGLFQTRILEWVAVPSLRDLTNLGIELRSPHDWWVVYHHNQKGMFVSWYDYKSGCICTQHLMMACSYLIKWVLKVPKRRGNQEQ